MMRLLDATKLATTKLRTRKVRLVVTVIIAGLLFSAMAAASFVSRGVFQSLASFNQEAFGERYIISAYPRTGIEGVTTRPEVIARAQAIHRATIARKIVEAKKLDIPYEEKNERSPVEEIDTGQGKQASVHFDHPAGRQAIKEYLAKHPAPGLTQLKKLAGPYGPTAFYQSKSLGFGPDAPTLKLLKDGKEQFEAGKDQGHGQPTGLESFTTSWGLMSRDLTKPFLLPGASTVIGKDGSIPVVAPYGAVEQLIGLKALPATATPDERLERIKQVRAGARDVQFQVCYRNKASTELLGRAVGQQRELARNKDNKDYTKPDLVYGLPAKACTAPVVSRDSRSAAEKQRDERQLRFERAFDAEAPRQAILKFRVVGIAPDPPAGNASVLSSLIGFLVSSNLGFGMQSWFTPVELQSQQPLLAGIFDSSDRPMPAAAGLYVEFGDAASAKEFMEQSVCEPGSAIPAGPAGRHTDPYADCARQGKHFALVPFGSNSLALEDAKQGFSRIFGYAALTVAAIAAIIMVGTVGRIIADSRRETAVFRAIGAQKLDIIQIYLVYTFFLSLMILAFALLAGSIVAQLAHARLSPEFTVQALVAFNAQDLGKTFDLYHAYLPDLLRLAGLALAGGALSAFFPLLRNLRRNPIRDMRDDT